MVKYDRENYRYLTEMFREIGYQSGEADDEKVKAVFCFLIAPDYRGKGWDNKIQATAKLCLTGDIPQLPFME